MEHVHKAKAAAAAAAAASNSLSPPRAVKSLSSSARSEGPAAAIKFLLSNSQAGLLIGKGGAKVQNIQLSSGCIVKVSTSGMYWP
eukprot:14096-Heterococcus_DN1.PRE.2